MEIKPKQHFSHSELFAYTWQIIEIRQINFRNNNDNSIDDANNIGAKRCAVVTKESVCFWTKATIQNKFLEITN